MAKRNLISKMMNALQWFYILFSFSFYFLFQISVLCLCFIYLIFNTHFRIIIRPFLYSSACIFILLDLLFVGVVLFAIRARLSYHGSILFGVRFIILRMFLYLIMLFLSLVLLSLLCLFATALFLVSIISSLWRHLDPYASPPGKLIIFSPSLHSLSCETRMQYPMLHYWEILLEDTLGRIPKIYLCFCWNFMKIIIHFYATLHFLFISIFWPLVLSSLLTLFPFLPIFFMFFQLTPFLPQNRCHLIKFYFILVLFQFFSFPFLKI